MSAGENPEIRADVAAVMPEDTCQLCLFPNRRRPLANIHIGARHSVVIRLCREHMEELVAVVSQTLGADTATRFRQPQDATTGAAAVFGKWPGDESEEELLKALEEME